ncbi:MAG TPA: HAMP domain-containing sensor histidine kinase [Acidimicrobiia bacterium]
MNWQPPPPPKRHLRSRLVAAMVALAIGVLAFTAFITLAVARKTNTDNDTSALESKTQKLADALDTYLQRPNAEQLANRNVVGTVIRQTLRISDASIVTITPSGEIVDGLGRASASAAVLTLPQGLDNSDLDKAALADGRQQQGQRGRLLFVAYPLDRTATGTPVVVVTQEIQRTIARGAGLLFFIIGGVATAVAALVAYFLARRLTRPIGTMQQTARRIAAGDLSARVDLGGHSNDELADLARGLNAMAAQLEHARGMERGFILSVSHDLRTPLTSIRGYAEAIADGAVEGADDRKRAAEIISSEARRLERLVADLLDLARLDAHQFSLTPRPVDAGEVVEAAVLAFEPAATELGLRLAVDARKPIPADADPERLGQIVANLVENALKYATTTIDVGVARIDGQVVIRVRDDGPGLSPEDVPHVFDRLYTSRTVAGRKVGTGLGLAIVRELAAAMGGSAWAEPAEGGGTRFVVRVPLPASVVPAPLSSPG